MILMTLALLSGILLGCAFPPIDWKWLVWIGLVPLLWAVSRSERPRQAFLAGYLAGLSFFLITLHPLISAHSWTGWAAETPEVFASRMSRQWWFMQGIWVSFALWGAIFWGVWALGLHRFGTRGHWRTLLFTPCLWIVFSEWARANTTFGFTWAFLGNATVDIAVIRQLAALGGVYLLSGLVIAVNVGIASLLRWREQRTRRWATFLMAAGLVAVSALFGTAILQRPGVLSTSWLVAAIQHSKAEYTTDDFAETGLDRNYIPLVQEALRRQVNLVMLPESIALGAVSLDGTASHTKPPEFLKPLTLWNAQMRNALAGSGAILILGADTVEQSEDHNTLIAWTAEGPVGWYHKRRLVPFSEYQPWGPWAIQGRSQYSPGRDSQLIRTHGMVIGGFICQEVLIPWVSRASARDGATILVTGGNDGVFGDPAVARIHEDAAQLRAVETGRFVIRAMKTGISAIIDPQGREVVRSRSFEPVVLVSMVSPRQDTTPYVRFGDWVVWMAAVLLIVGSLAVSDTNLKRGI